MYHKCDINVIEISAVKEFALAAEILYLALSFELASVFDFKQLLCRDCAELDLAGKSVKHSGLLERCRNTDECRALRIVTAGMHRARLGVSFGVGGADYRIKLAENKQGRPLFPGIESGVKAGNAFGTDDVVAEVGENLFHICGGLKFLVSRFGVRPYVALGIEDQLSVLFYCCRNFIHVYLSPWIFCIDA